MLMMTRGVLLVGSMLAVATCHRLTPTEQKVVGTWEYTGMDFTNRIVFREDHTVTTLFPDSQREEKWVPAVFGTWKLEGDELVTVEQFRNPYPIPGQTPARIETTRMKILEFAPDKLVREKPRAPLIRVK